MFLIKVVHGIFQLSGNKQVGALVEILSYCLWMSYVVRMSGKCHHNATLHLNCFLLWVTNDGNYMAYCVTVCLAIFKGIKKNNGFLFAKNRTWERFLAKMKPIIPIGYH